MNTAPAGKPDGENPMTYPEGCKSAREHRITAPVRDLWTAATYIERDGARMVASVEATRLGLSMFHGPAGAGCYTFTVDDADIPALDAARDRAYAKFRRPGR
jgi:hypothetical protein